MLIQVNICHLKHNCDISLDTQICVDELMASMFNNSHTNKYVLKNAEQQK